MRVIITDRAARRCQAFSLVELLVVVGIVALLVGILLPTLTVVRQRTQQVKCAAQLQQIGFAVQLYVNAWNTLHYSRSGVNWLATNAGTIALADLKSGTTYWGVPYADYLIDRNVLRLRDDRSAEILRAAARIWRCPSTVLADPSFPSNAADPVSYGINGSITGSSLPRWRRLSGYRNASNIVFAQDAIKVQMNAADYDTLSAFSRLEGATNLRQWRPGGDGYAITAGGVREYFRHRRSSNILWLDGHVTSVPETDGRDIPGEWYRPPYSK